MGCGVAFSGAFGLDVSEVSAEAGLDPESGGRRLAEGAMLVGGKESVTEFMVVGCYKSQHARDIFVLYIINLNLKRV